jgi:1,2-diacylglycerol-3-alpha-glucose alpha-1,2-galactosyltransferase
MLKVNMVSESTFTVQGHGVHTAFLEMTHALETSGEVNVVVNKFRRKADITHIQTFGPYSLLHLWFGAGKKVVSVHVVPDSLVGSIAGAQYFYGLAKVYLKLFYGRADLLLSVSKMVDDTIHGQLGIKKPSRVLYNTVDMSAYATSPGDRSVARTALSLKDGQKLVVSCAQIQPRKRFDVFCEVARSLPEARFTWIGGIPFKMLGADYGHMQKLLEAKPQNVTVTGVIEHEQVRRYLQAADVFFLPSEQENHPMAVLEAAGAGLPIVLRDIPEYNDTFKNDALRGTDSTFAGLISRLLIDEAFCRQAVLGSQDIAKRFDSVSGGHQLIEAYKSVLAAQ